EARNGRLAPLLARVKNGGITVCCPVGYFTQAKTIVGINKLLKMATQPGAVRIHTVEAPGGF
ncbi:hypothetical protein, partial [Salinisphaera hydrothermalis]|uniref:hypothetical protein n=1 Tax=Salinisphaera hydrothermalis TaxID=563188 RepID=UPI001E3F3848